MAYTEVNGEIWVYFGTGIYEQQVDKTNNITQYFFGLQDTASGVATYEMSDLAPLKAEFTTTQIGGKDVVVRTVSGENPPIPPYAALDPPISWAMELGPGASGSERVIVKPLVIGGIVFFTTFVPDADVCEGAGDTWVFALDYQSGLASTEPIFDLNGDGKFDDNDKIDTDSDSIKDTVPIGIHVGRGKGSHALKVNLEKIKVKVKAWKQS
jgi:Tfp pilus tip-associated adhesin PilY1